MGGLAVDLRRARERTLALVEGLSDEALHTPLDPIMSPLVWDLGHIAAYEDLWAVHRLGGEPLLREDLAALYDAFETPRAIRGEIALLDRAAALAYLGDVRARTLDVLEREGPSELHELVLRHELQHSETMRQALAIGGLLADGEPALAPQDGDSREMAEIPPGTFTMGAADDDEFAYDNERPAHEVDLPGFRIAVAPVTNGAWAEFIDAGGYERRELWPTEGWAWRQEHGVDTHRGARVGAPELPVMSVTWFEACAFARSVDRRLPTEAEWERASAEIAGVGQVWEWTSTEFDRYPGFRAHPYPEYSEVFFERGYRVLRGGSWATSRRVATRTFRNWDLPQRRQLFAGLRLAEDV